MEICFCGHVDEEHSWPSMACLIDFCECACFEWEGEEVEAVWE